MPRLAWHNREEDLTRAALTPYRLLEPVASLSRGTPDSPNMLIEGDNLDALKALLPYYAGRVKCVFIDPPYNTRSAFEHYDDNLEHSQWLSMMYPRLELLHELLSEDGSIWVTLDDNEAHYFKVICDEIFGRRNFVANAIWQKRFSPNSTAIHLSDSHDHVLVFAKQASLWQRNLLPRTAKSDSNYKNPDNDPRGVWTSSDLSARNFYSLGTYAITTPAGRSIPGPPPGRYWSVSQETFAQLQAENRIWWGRNGDGRPRLKRFLTDVRSGVVPQTVWLHDEVGNTQEAKKEAVSFNRDDVFTTPKPERLIKRILEIATQPGDLVLDSFLGSGTTAAVAHKMGRHWIGVELGGHAESHCQPRLKKVVDGEQGGISKAVNWHGGGGFRYYRLGAPLFDENGRIHEGASFEQLAAHVWFSHTGTARSDDGGQESFLGEHKGIGYYLLFNGIHGGGSSPEGNVLDRRTLRSLPPFNGPKVIYGETCRLSKEQLHELDIDFRQTPYDLRVG